MMLLISLPAKIFKTFNSSIRSSAIELILSVCLRHNIVTMVEIPYTRRWHIFILSQTLSDPHRDLEQCDRDHVIIFPLHCTVNHTPV